MRGFLLTTVEDLGLGIAGAIPGLFTVALIVCIARFVVRLIDALVQRGRAGPADSRAGSTPRRPSRRAGW